MVNEQIVELDDNRSDQFEVYIFDATRKYYYVPYEQSRGHQ